MVVSKFTIYRTRSHEGISNQAYYTINIGSSLHLDLYQQAVGTTLTKSLYNALFVHCCRSQNRLGLATTMTLLGRTGLTDQQAVVCG